jgi:hypothetical protein
MTGHHLSVVCTDSNWTQRHGGMSCFCATNGGKREKHRIWYRALNPKEIAGYILACSKWIAFVVRISFSMTLVQCESLSTPPLQSWTTSPIHMSFQTIDLTSSKSDTSILHDRAETWKVPRWVHESITYIYFIIYNVYVNRYIYI